MSFALPYRCEFGQNLSIVGSTTSLGSWDVDQSVDMEWTDGDVWRVELEIPARQAAVLTAAAHNPLLASMERGSISAALER